MYDPTTLMGLSDHVFIKTSVAIPYLISRHTISNHPKREEISYKWIDGTNITEYSQSAKTWTAHTQETAFIDQLQNIIEDENRSNDDRAQAVETFILNEAVAAGVVKRNTWSHPRNPNKWGKTLAPWFDEKCRDAKKQLTHARRVYAKGDDRILHAMKNFHKICLQRRSEFASETPDILKYHPKRFWGMLRTSKPNTGVTAQAFADFNEKLYFDASIPADNFTIPEDLNVAKIKP